MFFLPKFCIKMLYNLKLFFWTTCAYIPEKSMKGWKSIYNECGKNNKTFGQKKLEYFEVAIWSTFEHTTSCFCQNVL